MTEEQMRYLLESLIEECDGVRSVLLNTYEGLMISGMSRDVGEYVSQTRVSAFCSNISNASKRVAIEFGSGDIKQCDIFGSEGNIIIMTASNITFNLVCKIDGDARMDIISKKMREILDQLIYIMDGN